VVRKFLRKITTSTKNTPHTVTKTEIIAFNANGMPFAYVVGVIGKRFNK
jgi:hypothetical protein